MQKGGKTRKTKKRLPVNKVQQDNVLSTCILLYFKLIDAAFSFLLYTHTYTHMHAYIYTYTQQTKQGVSK